MHLYRPDPDFLPRSGSQFRKLFFLRNEAQRHAVVAVAQPGGFGTIVEDMALMPATAHAVIFGAWPNEPRILFCAERAWQRIKETGPPRATVKLRLAAEERQVARGANISACALLRVQRAGSRALGVLFEKNAVTHGGKQGFPFGFRFRERIHTAFLRQSRQSDKKAGNARK